MSSAGSVRPSRSPATSLWAQREWIASLRADIEALSHAINEPSDFSVYQWAQILAFTVDFQPDLIVELGRRFGNSTCCFLEAANRLQTTNKCRLLSLDIKDHWPETMARVSSLRSPDWFAPAQIVVGDILEYDFQPALVNTRRCLLFWDAHGFDIAECVLGSILPRLAGRPHLVLMHDISDARFEVSNPEYGASRLWIGRSAAAEYMWLGDRVSAVAQLISAIDFTTRNGIPFHSAIESFHCELSEQQHQELTSLLGDGSYTAQAHWHWFSMEEARKAISFPAWQKNGVSSNEAARLREENKHLQNTLNMIQQSAGWRLIEAARGLRNRVAPVGSLRRRLLDRTKPLFRG